MTAWDERPLRARKIVVRGLLIYVPFFALDSILLAIALAGVAGGNNRLIFLLAVTSIVGLLLGYQLLQHLRDLNGQVKTTDGRVSKKWTRSNLFFFFPSFYIAVRGSIFPIAGRQYGQLLEGDRVRVTHLPRTGTVEVLDRYDETQQKFILVPHDGAES